jgi:DNA topoisomerase-1
VTTKKSLVIVESPTKEKTIGKILGKDFVTRSSKGHIRDLPETRLGVDVANGFADFYLIDRDKLPLRDELQELAAASTTVLLATDPDREGEAIAWHLQQVIGPDKAAYNRIHFSEITREAIEKGVHEIQSIDMNLVEAQRTRRIMDRLIGYPLSDLLKNKVGKGVTAGRVQSPTVRMIVDRERERAAFVPREYWSVDADLKKHVTDRPGTFRAAFVGQIDGTRVEIQDAAAATSLKAQLETARFQVARVTTREITRQPAPPFITSTLQREAASKLHFTVGRTMSVAQELFEGVDVPGEGPVGLITYMRTDSTRLAESAVTEIRQYIRERLGPGQLSPDVRLAQGKVKGAQEGHEAIRPTSIYREPAAVKPALSPSQFNLYQLIWNRTVAFQMTASVSEQTTVDIEATGLPPQTPCLLKAGTSRNRVAGFMSLYTETEDEETAVPDAPGGAAPALVKGDVLDLVAVIAEQHHTRPPARFTESMLVKTLEQNGVGRPSTYASIIKGIQKVYVTKVGGSFEPTEAAYVVTDLLCQFFPDEVDIQFTSRMEAALDEIAEGTRSRLSVLQDFYPAFKDRLDYAGINMPKTRLPDKVTTEVCPECTARYGRVRHLVVKKSASGPFLGCPGFKDPEQPCSYTHPYEIRTGVRCPETDCGGEIVERVNQRGTSFWSCSNYPKCKLRLRDKPAPEPCPQCGGLVTLRRNDRAKCTKCGFEETATPVADDA